VNRLGDMQAPRLHQLLDSLCQHHTRSSHRIVSNHDFSQGNAYSYPGSNIVIELSVVSRLIKLKCKSGNDCIGGLLEFGQQRITPQFLHPALVLSDGLAKALKGILDALVSQLIILLYHLG